MNNNSNNCGDCGTTCSECGRPWAICKQDGGCGCNKCKDIKFCEYGRMANGCIREKQPGCPMQAVIPSVTVESIEGIKNLADCLVHVSDINTTFYVDDKHRSIITWAGPIDIPGYDMEGNPNNYRDQIVTDVANQMAVIYDKSGKGYLFGLAENIDLQEQVNNKLDEMAEDGTLQEIITQYIQSNVAWAFTSVANMKASTNLVAGSYAQTTGYYSNNDGGGALYYITDTEPSTYYETVGNLYAQLIIEGNRINAASYGIKGDGTFDDATAIQTAIDDACNYIQTRTSSTGAFGGPITVVLPDKKMYIKTQINTNEAIKLVGGGTSCTLVLANNINYMIKVDKDANTKTRNEETQIEGFELSNIRFDGNSRGYTCTSAVGVYHCDHFVLEELYFNAIKGKCIELAGSREGVANDIFTRFCGIYGSGCIEIVTNPNVGGDTSNLNYGNNWNIVYPFGAAIKFVDGEFHYVNNVLIHGMFDGIINSLSTYFGTNDYQDTDNDFIVLNNSNATFTNLETFYAPDSSVYVNMTGSTVKIYNAHFGGHKSNSESQSDGRFFKLATNSTLMIENVEVTMGTMNADIFIVDDTSKVKGSMNNTNYSDINADLQDLRRATKFAFEGEHNQPVYLGYNDGLQYTQIATGDRLMRINMYLGECNPRDSLNLNNKAMYIGTNQYATRTVVGIPDEGYFVLPQCNMSGLSYTANHAIFFDENNNLKVMLYDSNNNNWVIKTVTLS